MFQGILFDFDGVVVQSEPLHMKSFMVLLAPYGVKVSKERWYAEFAGTGSRHIFEVMVNEYSIKENVDALMEKRKKIYENYLGNGELKETPGVREFLDILRKRGIKTAIVSGSHRTNVMLAITLLKLQPYFDFIVSGDDLKERKPDPEPFLYAARKLGLRPEECIAIEDSAAGCEAARRAGMKLVVMRSPAAAVPGVISREDMIIADFRDAGLKALFNSSRSL